MPRGSARTEQDGDQPEPTEWRQVEASIANLSFPVVPKRAGPPWHSKHLLVDDRVAGVGTANLDNRSFRLNSEITGIVADERFAGQVARMFEEDFSRSRRMESGELARLGFWRRAFSRGAHLLSPVL